MTRLLPLIAILFLFSCSPQNSQAVDSEITEYIPLQIGAERMAEYLPLLEGKRVGLVVNQTSIVHKTHLVDTLLSLGVQIQKVMAPEHGFRGEAPDGQKIEDAKDEKTGIPIVSIYGSKKKPSPEMLEDVDVLIFDIQDVGVRFYTFISTMHYIMEAGAENGKEVIILDRPNPNGMYVDGPIKSDSISAFIAMHPIPIVHGLTVGELAQMINKEGWLANGVQCDLTVIPMEGWTHNDTYSLPIKPSPNLPNDKAIALYPSLGLFEGTVVSVGRGTNLPFQVLGHPQFDWGRFTFTPRPNAGSKFPPLQGEICTGESFVDSEINYELNIDYLYKYFNNLRNKTQFFTDYFTLLAGTEDLRKMIEADIPEIEVRKTWQADLDLYKTMRKQYLLYPDFE